MKKIYFTVLLFIFNFAQYTFTQNAAINSTGTAPDASAMLDVSSTTKGLLTPRMTAAQRGAISSPATGLIVYQTDGTDGFYYYDGSSWTRLINSGTSYPTIIEANTAIGATALGGSYTTLATITIPSTGTYLLTANLESNTSWDESSIRVKQGATFLSGTSYGSAGIYRNFSAILTLVSTTSLTFEAIDTAGSPCTISGNYTLTKLTE